MPLTDNDLIQIDKRIEKNNRIQEERLINRFGEMIAENNKIIIEGLENFIVYKN